MIRLSLLSRDRLSSTPDVAETRDRRRSPLGDVWVQVLAVDGPHVELPPFGRRAGDIRPLRKCEIAARRTLDVAVASMALIVTCPAFVGIAVVIKLTTRGPILFRQTRVGRGGCTFEVLKFRTMRVGTDGEILSDRGARIAFFENDFKLQADDPRITRLGRLLRRTSLDELPQLVNVLKGDMSMVGVRPVRPVELALRTTIDRELYCRLRPGLTGLWQVSGRSKVTHNQRVAIERAYSADWRFVRDLQILVRTPPAIVRSEGAL